MGFRLDNNIDKGWFRLLKMRNYNESIDYYLEKYNIDLDDYWILKYSNKFRFINKQDIEKYAGVICFKKDIFNKEDIDKWLNLINNKLKVNCRFLVRPFPPISVFNKIKIIG